MRFFDEKYNISFIKDITFFHKQGYYTTERYNPNNKFYLFSGSNFKNHKLDFYNCNKINASSNDYNSFMIKKGDILLVRSGNVGDYAIVEEDITNCIFGSYLIKFNIDNSKVINKYFCYFYESPAFKKQLKKIIQASANTNINADNIKSVKITYPSISEQEKVISFLTFIDQRINTQKKIIEDLNYLNKSIIVSLLNNENSYEYKQMKDILTIQNIKNSDSLLPVYSVAVQEGIINQITHLGRSFAAKDTTNYKIVSFGDIVYTKSPTGNFPYGIIKQSYIKGKVAVSPLYAIYKPENFEYGQFIHECMKMPAYANTYLHSLVQKGAKNTISIKDERFLEKSMKFPKPELLKQVSNLLTVINCKILNEKSILERYVKEKEYLLNKLFI